MKYINPLSLSPSVLGESLFNGWEDNMLDLFRGLSTFDSFESRSARSSWYENEDAYVARIDLPGVRSSGLSIEYKDGLVQIKGERSFASKETEEEGNVVYDYSLTIPDEVEEEAISADYENGVLSLTFPKVEKAKPRRIEVN